MPQIFNQSLAGANLMDAAGQGLAGVLEVLAHNKAQKMATQDSFKFWKSMGYGDEKATALSRSPLQMQKTILEGISSIGASPAQQQNATQYQGQEQYAPAAQEQRYAQQQSAPLNLGSLVGPSTGQPNFQHVLQALASGQPIAQQQVLGKQQEQINPLIRHALEQQALQQAVPQQQPMMRGNAPMAPQEQQRPMQQVQPQQAPMLQEPVYQGRNVKSTGIDSAFDPKHELALEKHRLAINEKNHKANAPFWKNFENLQDVNLQLKSKAQELKNLLDTGNVASSWKGKLSTKLLSKESGDFEKVANEIASLIASRSGVATNFKIKLAQSTKPNLEDRADVQRQAVNRLIKDAEKLDLFNDAVQQVIQENGGVEPANIGVVARTRFHELEKQKEKQIQQMQKNDPLVAKLSSKKYPVGTEIRHKESGRVFEITENGPVEKTGG